MTEELKLANKLMYAFLPDESSAAMIRAYGDWRVEAAMHKTARLARWRDLCLDKIDERRKHFMNLYDLWRKADTELIAQKARIAELEAQLATVKDECADRAVAAMRNINSTMLKIVTVEGEGFEAPEIDMRKAIPALRAAIKGE